MFIIKFLRYLRGIVFFTATGGFPERFLNLCSNKNITLQDLKIKDGILFASTDIKNYKRLRRPAKKSGMRVRITKKFGLPFLSFKYKHRFGLVCGAVIFGCTLAFLSCFIWTVNVSGSAVLSDNEIIKEVNNAGIRAGALRKSLSIEQTEELLLKKFPQIAFAAVNVQGSSVQIKIKEKPMVHINDSTNDPCDIIASNDGQLVTVEAYGGTQLLNVNDAVLKGDVILSSVVENMNGSYTFKKAQGYITAKTNNNISYALSADKAFFKIDKINEQRELFFFHLKAPLNKAATKDNSFTEDRRITFKDKRLPIGILKSRSIKLKASAQKITASQSQLIAFDGFCCKSSDMLRYKKLVSGDVLLNSNRICTQISGDFVLLENIGAKKPIILENN